MTALQTDLTHGSVSKKLVQYTVPLMTSSLLQAVYSITDIIVAGHCIGDNGISAINNASIIMNMITNIAIGLTMGGNILVGQYFGKGDHESRRRASGTLFLFSLLVGAAAAVCFAVFARPLMTLMDVPALEDGVRYFGICTIGIFFIFCYNALSAILRGIGNSRVPLYCVLVSVGLNVVLDIVFMAVLGWGVAGAALATVLGQSVSFLTALVFALRHRADLGLQRRWLRLPRDMLKSILKLSLPTALQSTIGSISWLTVVTLINRYGVEISAGNGVANKVRDFCQLFIVATTTGAGTMCAQCMGAGLYDRAEQVMKTCMKITLGMAAVIIVIAEIFAPQLCAVFTPDPAVQEWAVLNLRIEIVCRWPLS